MSGSTQAQQDPDELVSSIFEKDDADEDGLLSIEETPLDEEKFNSIDSDGDGMISQEELSADIQSKKNEMMGQMSMQMQSLSAEEMAQSIIDQDDTDDDGLLTLEETPLDEELFNSIDTDGDGMLSAEELSADMEQQMSEEVGMGTADASSSSQSASGTASEEDEEYDENNLNQDGEVTFDELLQAFQKGDTSLNSYFKSLGDTPSPLKQRMGMQAYGANI